MSSDLTNLTEAIQQFNYQEFYACHDLLEAMWIDAYYPEKNFYQGLLRIAVGLYHLSDRNWNGSKIILGEGIMRLRDFQPEYMGVNVTKLIQESADLLKILQKSGKEELDSLSFKLPEIDYIPSDRHE
jgi:predicted metal-dependent hydrolase